jgi:predicted dehydrogenase
LVVHDPDQGRESDLRDVDAVVVATPTVTHLEVALPFARRGIPCLIEKPLAHTVDAARALAAFPHVAVGHVERFNPALAPIFDGSPPGPLAPVSSAGSASPDVRFVQSERVARPHARGRDVDVVLDLMIHDLDLFLALVREPVVEVRANGAAIAGAGLDVAHARVETVSGRVGVFTASRLARGDARRMRIFADGSYWSVNLHERTCARVGWDGTALVEQVAVVPERDALATQLEAFLCVARGQPEPAGALPLATGADGLAALTLAEEIRAAALRTPGALSGSCPAS